jgi:hypothetical protein
MMDEAGEKRSGSHWLAVAAIVAVLVVAGAAGAYVYHAKQQEALAECRQSVAEFSSARKAILDTSDNSGELQKLIRSVLGVNDILDAFSDAATSAEGTVDTEGCSAGATITQLNLVSKTLHSATDSLKDSLAKIQAKNQSSASSDSGDASDGTASDGDSSAAGGDGGDSTDDKTLSDAKAQLSESIDKAQTLLERLSGDSSATLTGRKLLNALSKAVDAGQKLIDDSGIKDSKYYKAAKVTLDEAITMADNWVDGQSSKAE